jgi:hypothetical protein
MNLPDPTAERQSLHKVTRHLLFEDKRSLLDIHKSSGVPYHWLKKFSSDIFANPSVNRVQCLYEFLSGTKLLDK